MDARQRHRQQVEYFRRAHRHLLKHAGWLRAYRTPRTSVLAIDHPGLVTRESIKKTKAFLASRGLRPLPRRWRRSRKYAEFIVDAPNQPRPLQILNAFRRDRIQPLRIALEIDGSMLRCLLRYAGFTRMSDQRWTTEERREFLNAMSFPRDPEGDVEYLLSFIEAIIQDRLGLLRFVQWREIGHGSGLFPCTSDALVESGELVRLPDGYGNIGCVAEAILYTWSAEGDRVIVVPNGA